MPSMCNEQAPISPPSYSRAQVQAQAERARALHINALTLIQTLHPAFLVPLGREGGASALSAALAQRPRWCSPHLPRGVLAADRLAENAVAALPPGRA